MSSKACLYLIVYHPMSSSAMLTVERSVETGLKNGGSPCYTATRRPCKASMGPIFITPCIASSRSGVFEFKVRGSAVPACNTARSPTQQLTNLIAHVRSIECNVHYCVDVERGAALFDAGTRLNFNPCTKCQVYRLNSRLAAKRLGAQCQRREKRKHSAPNPAENA